MAKSLEHLQFEFTESRKILDICEKILPRGGGVFWSYVEYFWKKFGLFYRCSRDLYCWC